MLYLPHKPFYAIWIQVCANYCIRRVSKSREPFNGRLERVQIQSVFKTLVICFKNVFQMVITYSFYVQHVVNELCI
jgi:hypothetical protein